MSRAITLAGFATLLLSACALRPTVTNQLTFDFPADPRQVRIAVATTISDEAATPRMAERLKSLRDSIASGQDEWSLRFGAIHSDEEHFAIDRRGGAIVRVEHSATIQRDEMMRFFADTAMTVTLTHNAGVSELSIITASSTRATRQQRDRVMTILDSWSDQAARYLAAMSRLYAYLDRTPERAQVVFEQLLGDRNEKSTIDEEQADLEAVWDAMDRIDNALHEQEEHTTSIDEEFDLVFNPFPAGITVRTPHAIAAVENFAREGSDAAVIHRAGLADAIAALEGRWLSPDPFALVLSGRTPEAGDMAAQPRHASAVVTPVDIRQAVIEQLTPAPIYRVRWLD